MLTAVLAAWPAITILDGELLPRAGALLGGVAVSLVAVGLVLRFAAAVTAGLALAGALYAATLALEDRPIDRAAPVFAAGLFLAAELAWWSLELRSRIAGEAGSQLGRLAFVLMLTVGAFALGGGVLAAVDLVQVDGFVVVLLGAAAAVGAAGLAVAGKDETEKIK